MKELPNETTRRRSRVWVPFAKLLSVTKLPWLAIIALCVLDLTKSKLFLLFPQYTQQITAGDISIATFSLMVAVVIGKALLTGASSALDEFTNAKFSLRLRDAVWGRILRLPTAYYDKNMSRDFITRLTSDTDLVSANLVHIPSRLLTSLYTLIATFMILFTYDYRLAIAEAIMVPLTILGGLWEGHVHYKRMDKVQGKLAKLSGYLAETLTHLPLVKTFVKEEQEDKRGHEVIEELNMTSFKYNAMQITVMGIVSQSGTINNIVTVLVGAWLTSIGAITVDIWLAFYLFSGNLLTDVRNLMSVWTGLKDAQGAASRIASLATDPLDNYSGDENVDLGEKDLSVEDLTFRYGDKAVLSNVSLRIPQGKVTALVGPSGSGKSTLLSLLDRFYQPSSGSINVGENPISRYALSAWRDAIGYVSQDTLLFDGTIRENILYGLSRTVSEEEFQKAVDAACVTEFVKTMEKGFDTKVGESGGKLSGGQRQRIGIARAILRDPQLLLLDEVTANLDAESEAKVNEALVNVTKGLTTVMVAHRLDSVQNADQIVVMAAGKVHGKGTHSELMKNDDLYRQMVAFQKQNVTAKVGV